MSVTKVSRRPCKIELCPALAVRGSRFCVAHTTAKKLNQIQAGTQCVSCKLVLHPGDYVTIESSPGRMQHAVCPKNRPKAPARRKGETPLFDDATAAPHA